MQKETFLILLCFRPDTNDQLAAWSARADDNSRWLELIEIQFTILLDV